MKRARLFSALAGAAGPGYLQEVLGRTGGRPEKHRLEGGRSCLWPVVGLWAGKCWLQTLRVSRSMQGTLLPRETGCRDAYTLSDSVRAERHRCCPS